MSDVLCKRACPHLSKVQQRSIILLILLEQMSSFFLGVPAASGLGLEPWGGTQQPGLAACSARAFSVIYSLRGCPYLAVKEIQLDGLGQHGVDAIRTRLTALLDLSHPGVFRHHQVVEDEGLIYVVTDRHDKTLEYLLTEHKQWKIPVSTRVILSAMKQVAAALAYLHGLSEADTRGFVHRDLRPANVFISADGERFVIADFGLCKDALRCGSTIAGTAVYVAPEALLRGDTTAASDVWSLGVILYEMATLRRPDFLGDRDPAEVFVDGWRPDLSDVVDDLARSVLERMLVLDSAERLTARELVRLLRILNISADGQEARSTRLKVIYSVSPRLVC